MIQICGTVKPKSLIKSFFIIDLQVTLYHTYNLSLKYERISITIVVLRNFKEVISSTDYMTIKG